MIGKNIYNLSYRVQLHEAIFYEYANEWSGVSRLASNNTLPRLRNRHCIRKITRKYSPWRKCVVCMNGMKETVLIM